MGYFLEVNFDYPKELFSFHKDLLFLPKRSMMTEQNFVTQILIPLLFTLKPKIFVNILLMMLRDGLTYLIIMIKDLYQ